MPPRRRAELPAGARGWPENIAVVDSGANLVAFVRMDGAQLASIASRGGIPLIEDGRIIGGIGCSGGTGSQDEMVCTAGAGTIK